MKTTRRPHKWPAEVVEMLYAVWGIRTPAAVATYLTQKTGKTYTRGAVLQKAGELGLTAETAQPYMSMADAAREMAIPYHTLLWHCKRQGLKMLDKGSVTFLSDEAWAAVQAHYAPPPEPTVSVAEAARRLCYSQVGIRQMVRRGTLPAYRFGARLRIPLAEVEHRERSSSGARLIGDGRAS